MRYIFVVNVNVIIHKQVNVDDDDDGGGVGGGGGEFSKLTFYIFVE